MLIPPRNIQALACCAGACLQSFCTWGNFNRRKWGNFNRRKLGNIQPALTDTRTVVAFGDLAASAAVHISPPIAGQLVSWNGTGGSHRMEDIYESRV
jgi:hypothetical protein